jgi:hypothetical protein
MFEVLGYLVNEDVEVYSGLRIIRDLDLIVVKCRFNANVKLENVIRIILNVRVYDKWYRFL